MKTHPSASRIEKQKTKSDCGYSNSSTLSKANKDRLTVFWVKNQSAIFILCCWRLDFASEIRRVGIPLCIDTPSLDLKPNNSVPPFFNLVNFPRDNDVIKQVHVVQFFVNKSHREAVRVTFWSVRQAYLCGGWQVVHEPMDAILHSDKLFEFCNLFFRVMFQHWHFPLRTFAKPDAATIPLHGQLVRGGNDSIPTKHFAWRSTEGDTKNMLVIQTEDNGWRLPNWETLRGELYKVHYIWSRTEGHYWLGEKMAERERCTLEMEGTKCTRSYRGWASDVSCSAAWDWHTKQL